MKQVKIVNVIMLLLLTSVMFGFAVQGGTNTKAGIPQITNIAVGKKPTASGMYKPWCAPGNAVDGDPQTIWGSELNKQTQWLYVDLGEITDISGFKLEWYNIYYAREFAIYTSQDLKTWEKLYEEPHGLGYKVNRYVGSRCRYVGILMTRLNDIAYGIKEFEILSGVTHEKVVINDDYLLSHIISVLKNSKLVKETNDVYAADMLNIILIENFYKDPMYDLTGLEYALFMETLVVEDNELTDITPIMNLPSLRNLRLARNKIERLPDLSGLPNIGWVHLENNAITHIEKQNSNASLKYLYLQNNLIPEMPDMSPFSAIDIINLDNNAVEKIAVQGSNTSLRLLKLSNNKIQTIPDGVLDGYSNLTELTLAENNLDNVSGLSDVPNLNTLDISRNNFTSLRSVNLFKNLMVLLADDNQITDMNGIGAHASLTTLRMKNNMLTSLTALGGFTGTSAITIIDVADNSIDTLEGIGTHTNLKSLTLSNNGLTNLNGLADCPALTELYLSHNRIKNFAGFGSRELMKVLIADNNVIEDFEGLIIPNIEHLDLSHNNITTCAYLKLTKEKLSDRHQFYFQHNQISDIAGLKDIIRFEQIDLSYNNLTNCDNLGTIAFGLILDLSHNAITDISGLPPLKSIGEMLNLSFNPLSDINPLNSAGYHHRLVLELNDTLLTDFTSLQNIDYLMTLDISNTPVTDLSSLTTIPYINVLDISNTAIADLTPIGKTPTIRTLKIPHTLVTDITPLAGQTGLYSLDISNTMVRDLSCLADKTLLQTLDMSNTPVTDLSPLSGLDYSFETLIAWKSAITDLSPLAGCKRLETINVGSTAIGDISTLFNLLHLRHVEIDDCGITDITPLRPLPLEYLDISKNAVKDILSLSGKYSIKTLNVEDNGMYIIEDGAQGSVNLAVITGFLDENTKVSYKTGNIVE